MAHIIHVGGKTERIVQELTLEYMQSVVGGYIDRIELNDNFYLFVNEDGKGMNLPFNFMATMLWWKDNIAASMIRDVIVGDVIMARHDEVVDL